MMLKKVRLHRAVDARFCHARLTFMIAPPPFSGPYLHVFSSFLSFRNSKLGPQQVFGAYFVREGFSIVFPH